MNLIKPPAVLFWVLAWVASSFGLSLLPSLTLTPYPMLAMVAGMIALIVIQYRLTKARAARLPIALPPAPPAKPPAIAILIIGPYAAKWFNHAQQEDNVRQIGHVTWLQVANPTLLAKRVRDLRQRAADTRIMAFLPLLPDGHETSDLIIQQLNHWQGCFYQQDELATLPCAVAVYTRLSNERRNNSPHNASWLGELAIDHPQQSWQQAVIQLKQQLHDARYSASPALQRAVLGHQLLHWLENTGLAQSLENLFREPALRFTRLLLCDYGDGFPRHGAWSNWLESHYAILPPIGRRLTLPPCPPVVMPVPLQPVASPPAVPPRPAAGALWSIPLVLLLLITHITVNGYRAKQQYSRFQQQQQSYTGLAELSVYRLQQDSGLMARRQQQWQACAEVSSLATWGLSPCHRFANQLAQRRAQLDALPYTSSFDGGTLFDSGSAQLHPSSPLILQRFVAMANAWPDHQILIVGHSDNTGSPKVNQRLSQQRAKAVQQWLIRQQVNAGRILLRAVGATEPVASNTTAEGRRENRRVDLLILPTNNEMEFTKQ